jgi:hypothetical protein
VAQLQEAFLAIQPRLLLHARIVFRHVRCPQQRADHIAEVIGLCWKWFIALARRGKDARQFVNALATYAARAVRSGRRVCGQERSRDVLSRLARQRHGFRVESLPLAIRLPFEEEYARVLGPRRMDVLEERLQDNRQTPVPEQVIFRCDFPCWLQTRTPRDRSIIADMVCDESTTALARKYGVSAGRISQLRREYYRDWQRFGEAEDS